MKRPDALRKVHAICGRLDQIDLATFPIVPFKLYLFGSVLTDKPDPHDVDLVLIYEERPDYDPAEIAMRLAYHEPLPFDQASTLLRRRMQMIRLFPACRTLAAWEYMLLFPRLASCASDNVSTPFGLHIHFKCNRIVLCQRSLDLDGSPDCCTGRMT